MTPPPTTVGDMTARWRVLVVVAALIAAACTDGEGGLDSTEVLLPDDATTTITTVTIDPSVTVPPGFDVADSGVWFAPVPPRPATSPDTLPDGSEDYWQLFEDPDSWRDVAGELDAIKIHGWMFRFVFTDEQIETIIAGLDDLGLALIVEVEPLDPPDPSECRHSESFEGPFELATLRRIERLGGTVAAIAIEQPHTFATLSDEPGAAAGRSSRRSRRS